MGSSSGNVIRDLKIPTFISLSIFIHSSSHSFIHPSRLSSPCRTQQMLHSFKSRGSTRTIPPPVHLFPPLSIIPSLCGINLTRGNCSHCLMVTGLIKHDGFTTLLWFPLFLFVFLSGSSWFSGCCCRPSFRLPDEVSAAVVCVGSTTVAY